MNCSMCEIQCIIPDGSTLLRSSANVAVKKDDGIIICTACSEISDWADSVVGVNKTNIKKDQCVNKTNNTKTEKPVSNSNNANNVGSMVHCPKCNDKFSTRVCKCGFKNPLFRK